MKRTVGELREGFRQFLGREMPGDADRILNATEFGLQVLLLGQRELKESEDVYSITDLERVDRWCDRMRSEATWQLMDGSGALAKALTAYRRYVEWLDLEKEKVPLKPARPVTSTNGGTYLLPESEITEGAAQEVVLTKYERNPKARELCIAAYGGTYRCEVCGFDFQEHYGPRLAGKYIEVHHIAEHAKRSAKEGQHVVDCKNDLIPLCANCHRMIHFLRAETLHPDELRTIWNERHDKKG